MGSTPNEYKGDGMMEMRKKWAVMVEVTNKCGHNCLYCCKHTRHLRPDQFYSLNEDEIRRAIESVKTFPGKVGITGGEPLSHLRFDVVCKVVKETIPKEKAIIFTSSAWGMKKYKKIIDETFGEVYINYHTNEQREKCYHQPMLLSVGDVVEDRKVQDVLIGMCWCDKMWSPIVGRKAYFCDCALGFDTALDINGGWEVECGWWEKGEDEIRKQREKYCYLCGMCVPLPARRQNEERELISKGLYEKFEKAGLRNLDKTEIVEMKMGADEVIKNAKNRKPWHNRQDRGENGEGPEYINC